jgi:hypothetical protein
VNLEEAVLAFDQLCAHRLRHLPPLPNFIGVGASRCGTTSMFFYLRSHPDVFMSYVKEINYFGLKSRATRGPERGISVDLYRLYFLGHRHEKVIGEISPIYLSQPRAAHEIRSRLGADCKIIAQIRHPVDRFASQFSHHVSVLPGIAIDDYVAIALQTYSEQSCLKEWNQPDRNLVQSLYARDLERYLKQFGKNNVLIIEYKELSNAASLATKICRFLEIAPHDAEIPVTHRSKQVAPLSDLSREKLLEFFRPDTEKTAQLTGLDLAHWST